MERERVRLAVDARRANPPLIFILAATTSTLWYTSSGRIMYPGNRKERITAPELVT